MSFKIGIVCGSFHREYVSKMLEAATKTAAETGLEIVEVIWVPGSMETPLALDRLLSQEAIAGAACLGIIEKGETQHGLAMGQAVIKSIIELQLVHEKPIGLGIIGPGAEIHHIEPRLAKHARAAIEAINTML